MWPLRTGWRAKKNEDRALICSCWGLQGPVGVLADGDPEELASVIEDPRGADSEAALEEERRKVRKDIRVEDLHGPRMAQIRTVLGRM